MNKLLFLLFFISIISFGQTAIQYSYSGDDKFENGDYEGAIEDYTKVIEMSPNDADILKLRDLGFYHNWFANVYNSRGSAKQNLKDFTEAIEDYKKAIEFEPDKIMTYENIVKSIIELKTKTDDEMGSLGTSNADYNRYDELKIERDKLDSEITRYINKIIEIDESNDFANQIKRDMQKENDFYEKVKISLENIDYEKLAQETIRKTVDEWDFSDLSEEAMQFRITEESLSQEEKEFRTGQINYWISLENDVGIEEDGIANLGTLNENNHTIVYQFELKNKQLEEYYKTSVTKEMLIIRSPNAFSKVCKKRQIIAKYKYFFNDEIVLELKVYPNEWND